MIKRNCQTALCVLAAVLFGTTADGWAQAPTVTCSGGNCPGPQIAITAMGGTSIGPAQIGIISTSGMSFASPESAEVVKNLPYQAQAITQIKQVLADGTHITQTITATVARDSDGRTLRVQKLSTIGPWKSSSDSSPTNAPTLTIIFDPVSQTHTDYTSDSRVAHVMPLLVPPAGATTASISSSGLVGPGPGAHGGGPTVLAFQGQVARSDTGAGPDVKTEPLTSKTIEGIPVTGTETTTTIPAGMIGNDKDIVIAREIWYSPDLQLVVKSTQTDPRFGVTTYTLTYIQRSEPDPSLFQVPAGYTIDKLSGLR